MQIMTLWIYPAELIKMISLKILFWKSKSPRRAPTCGRPGRRRESDKVWSFYMDAYDFAFDSAFVDTSKDFECSMITPVTVPWIVNEPIVHIVLSSPSNDLNGMTTKCLAFHVLINARFICWEIFIDSEGSFNWTICHDFLLNCLCRFSISPRPLIGGGCKPMKTRLMV